MRRIQTTAAPAAAGPYSQGIIAGGLLYTAGQIALTTDDKLANATIETEVRQIMANLQAILEAGGCTFANVVHARIYIADRALFGEVNAIYASYFADTIKPARECVVAQPPLEGANVEISLIAHFKTGGNY